MMSHISADSPTYEGVRLRKKQTMKGSVDGRNLAQKAYLRSHPDFNT
jgi:hypothetical protein